MADFSSEIMGLGDQIANLKVSQAVELGNYLEEKYGIKAAAGAVMAAAPTAVGPAPVPDVQTEFTVTLDGLADPAKKIQVIKVVRELTSQGLAEAKATVEGCAQAHQGRHRQEDRRRDQEEARRGWRQGFGQVMD